MKKMFVLFCALFTSTMARAEVKTSIYGFVKASAVVSDRSVESNGRQNAVAYNAASNPVLALRPNKPSSSFQVQQSRFGLKVDSDEGVGGLLEFDFVDFSKSTPAVASVIRLRRALVNLKQDDWTFVVGQDWDLVSPLAPYSYNLIGHYFGTGDIGFMRLQAQALKKSGNFEHAAAIGFPGYNNGPNQGTPEYSVSPTLALRETVTLDKTMFGISGIVGHIENPTTEQSMTPYAVNLFFKHDWEQTTLVSEAYYGQNLENLSLSGIGALAANNKRLEEMGGFFTVRHKVSEKNGFFGGLGYSQVNSANNVLPSYSLVAGKNTLNLLNSTSTGYGIAQNGTARLGYERYWNSKLNLFIETAFLYTQHILDPADKAKGFSEYNHAQVVEIGLKLDI